MTHEDEELRFPFEMKKERDATEDSESESIKLADKSEDEEDDELADGGNQECRHSRAKVLSTQPHTD